MLHLIKPVFNDHLSYMTLFQWPLGSSHKTDLTGYIHYLVVCTRPNLPRWRREKKTEWMKSIKL